MGNFLKKQLFVAALCIAALSMTASYANSGLAVFLRDGRVIQVPVDKDDIIGISFEEDSPAARKIPRADQQDKSTGVDTCTNRLQLCQAGATTSYEKCIARAGANPDLRAQCEQDSRVTQQACQDRFYQCIKD